MVLFPLLGFTKQKQKSIRFTGLLVLRLAAITGTFFSITKRSWLLSQN
jgi:hypothetical protein